MISAIQNGIAGIWYSHAVGCPVSARGGFLQKLPDEARSLLSTREDERLEYITLPCLPGNALARQGKEGSHFLPNSPIFSPHEKRDVLTSSALWLVMALFLGFMTCAHGWLMVKLYWLPYVIFVIWLDLVTYLHHTEPDIPWYRNNEWYFLKGAFSTIDRNYGWINEIHHHIGTHVVHHIFLSIPHYYLKEATAAIKPVLGEYYRSSNQPIWQSFINSYLNCHFVPNEGDKVFYQKRQ